MACCRCKEFKWKDPQEVVYTDPKEGKEYCLFHAPAEHKGIDVHDFNAQVSERIQATIDLGDDNAICDLCGTIFPGDICFDNDCELPSLYFFDCVFMGTADFRGAEIGGGVNFSEAHIAGKADFSGVHIEGEADFREVHIEGGAFFGKAHIGGGASFREAKVGGIAFFVEAEIGGYTSFDETQIKGDVFFLGVDFVGGARFTSFIVASDATFCIAGCTVPSAGLTFKDCDPTCLDLAEQYDLSNVRFINAPWEKNGRIKACTEDDSNRLQSTRDFYQRMKAKCKAENNEYEASKWHVAEKAAQLKLLIRDFLGLKDAKSSETESELKDEKSSEAEPWWQKIAAGVRWVLNKISLLFSLIMLFLYGLSSGYGERPARALLWLGVLVGVSAFFPGDMRGYIPLMNQVTPPGVLAESSVFQSFGRIGWQLFISLQAALFAFALRNNFRR